MAISLAVSVHLPRGFRRYLMEEERKSAIQKISTAQIQQIQKIAETIRYGSITLVFQDGVLIQIDRNEKIRVPKI